MDTVLALGIPETDSALQAMRAVDAKHDSTEKAVGAVTVIDISSGSITVHVKEGNWAMLELDDWNRFNAKHIALAPKIVDVHTIAFTAGDTVVTKTRLDRNRVQISCNAPAKYPTYIVYDQPTDVAQCSEGWFSAFVSAHYRLGGAARAASAPSLKPTRRWF